MTEVILSERTLAWFTTDLQDANERIIKLEEENKKLKLVISQMENTCKDYLNDRDLLREENRSLKKENKRLMSDLITTIEERDNNIKRVEELEERLDNKEKVNKQLREDIGKLVMKH